MRKASMFLGLVGLMSVASAGAARAQEASPVAVTSAAPAKERKLQVSLAFLPMSLGKFSAVYGGMPSTLDAAFAPGVGLSVGYEVVRGLTVGLAPQAIFNVKPKEDPISTSPPSSKEVDVMARIAYAFPLADTIAIYGEVLPGYSLIQPSAGNTAKGFIIGLGAGLTMDLTNRTFVYFGAGYQWGYQSRTDTTLVKDMMTGATTEKKVVNDVKTDYLRVALGVGWRF